MVLLLCFDLGGHARVTGSLYKFFVLFRPYQKLLGVVLVVYRNWQEFPKEQG
jgi:hypothetical protein